MLDRVHRDAGDRALPVIVTCGTIDAGVLHQCLRDGADDYLIKPIDPAFLRLRVDACLHRATVRSQTHPRSRFVPTPTQNGTDPEHDPNQLSVVMAMTQLAESRDPALGRHLERVERITGLIVRRLLRDGAYPDAVDEAFARDVPAASVLHDIGKVAIPDRILLKPGPFNAAERRHMERHTTLGAATLRAILRQHPASRLLQVGVEIAESHHERWDGGGYPRGLAGDAIPLSARIVAVADVYDALTTPRCYRNALPADEARDVMRGERGLHFDPILHDVFESLADQIAEACEEIDRNGNPASGRVGFIRSAAVSPEAFSRRNPAGDAAGEPGIR